MKKVFCFQWRKKIFRWKSNLSKNGIILFFVQGGKKEREDLSLGDGKEYLEFKGKFA